MISFNFSLYVSSLDDIERIMRIMAKSELYTLFLSFPGKLIERKNVVIAFETLMGCIAEDNDLNLQYLDRILSRLLRLAHMRDVDDRYVGDLYGTEKALHVLEKYGLDLEQDVTMVDSETESPPSPNYRSHRETFFFGKKVAEGYGYNEPDAAMNNSNEIQTSRLVEEYCRALQKVYFANVSKRCLSELNFSPNFKLEESLYQYFQIEAEDFDDYFDYFELEKVCEETNIKIPIRLPLFLCIIADDGKVESAGVHITPRHARLIAMRRLSVSLREGLPIQQLIKMDPALNRHEVYDIMAGYYPDVPYDLEVIRPYVAPPLKKLDLNEEVVLKTEP